jgi:hypothetical protein
VSEIASATTGSNLARAAIAGNLVFDGVSWTSDHPVATALIAAANGQFPEVDGAAEIVAPDAAGTHAVVSFTGHSFVMTTLDPDRLARFGIDGYGGAMDPNVLTWLAGAHGEVGSIDAVLVRRGIAHERDAGASLPRLDQLDDLDDHPRVRRARHHRRHVRVIGDDRGFVTIGQGLVDRTEVSIELTSGEHGAGTGRRLLMAALAKIDADQWVFAQVAPGNAASLRLFLACGFVPIGSEVLIEHRP